MYRFDTHVHTSETSPCGNVTAQDTVRLYHNAGYSGICITDHFYARFFESLPASQQEKAVDRYLLGYRNAKECGRQYGMDILLGAEIQLTGSANEYLLFGITEAFLYQYPQLYQCTLAELHALTAASGILIFAAHPFRPHLTRDNRQYLDGVEVMNGNPRHQSHNDLALAFARENKLPISGGSDCHEIEDVGRSGILTDARIGTLEELKTVLIGNQLTIIE